MENTAIWSKAIRFLLLGSTRAILITRLCRPSKNTIFMCSVAVQFDQNVMENLIDQSKLHLYGQLKRDVWHSFFAHLWPRVYQVTPPPPFSLPGTSVDLEGQSSEQWLTLTALHSEQTKNWAINGHVVAQFLFLESTWGSCRITPMLQHRGGYRCSFFIYHLLLLIGYHGI